MITKAYILDINPQSNKYYIRIPIFDKPGLSADNSTFSGALFYATLSHEPTSKESYKVGDTVFVGFENNDLNKPIIIGKLYTLGEEPSPTGAIDVKSLTVYDKAILPANTTIGSVNFSNISNFFASINDRLNEVLSDSITHNELAGRTDADAHPISSITNLQTELNSKATILSASTSTSINSTTFVSAGSFTLTQGKTYYIAFAGKYSQIYTDTSVTPSFGVFFSNTTTATVPTIFASGAINSTATETGLNSFTFYTASTLDAGSAGSYVTGPAFTTTVLNAPFSFQGTVYAGTGVTRTLYLGAKNTSTSSTLSISGRFIAIQLD